MHGKEDQRPKHDLSTKGWIGIFDCSTSVLHPANLQLLYHLRRLLNKTSWLKMKNDPSRLPVWSRIWMYWPLHLTVFNLFRTSNWMSFFCWHEISCSCLVVWGGWAYWAWALWAHNSKEDIEMFCFGFFFSQINMCKVAHEEQAMRQTFHLGPFCAGVNYCQWRARRRLRGSVKASIQLHGNADAIHNPPCLHKYNFAIILLLLWVRALSCLPQKHWTHWATDSRWKARLLSALEITWAATDLRVI